MASINSSKYPENNLLKKHKKLWKNLPTIQNGSKLPQNLNNTENPTNTSKIRQTAHCKKCPNRMRPLLTCNLPHHSHQKFEV